jgi:hypothetical protein
MRILCAAALAFAILSTSTAAAERAKRPMVIHRVPQVGLQIWIEQDPVWETRLETIRGAPVFVAETPALTYPPASMSWISLPHLKFEEGDLETAARGVLHEAATNHGVRIDSEPVLERKTYGELSGYEATFSAHTDGVPIDVRIFCGHRSGMPAVVMHVSTVRGKLGALAEHIRRSWTNVHYLR